MRKKGYLRLVQEIIESLLLVPSCCLQGIQHLLTRVNTLHAHINEHGLELIDLSVPLSIDLLCIRIGLPTSRTRLRRVGSLTSLSVRPRLTAAAITS